MPPGPEDKVKKRRLETVVKLNKRLCKEVRVTAWRDSWELESVGRGLLSILLHDDNVDPIEGVSRLSTSNNILKALDMVNVWKARSHALEALPHAVEATAAIAQVVWRDQQYQLNRRTISATELRLAYSSAIVRCINGFADALQQQRFVAAPISILCGQLGIPSWLVDIRHEASHNELPTLPVLKLAAITLLEYLQNEYWIPTCPQWNLTSASMHEDPGDESNDNIPILTAQERAINLLIDYQKCVTNEQNTDNLAENCSQHENKINDGGSGPSQKQSETSALMRPFDTFFGDRDNGGSDGDGDDDDDGDNEYEDPLLGNFWGSSIGTNTNRFAALEPPKKVKPQPKPKQKQKPKKQKKPPVQMQNKIVRKQYHIDFGNNFVTMVSPLEGYSILMQFFVWGGIGGLPQGHGALTPANDMTFPATQMGFQTLQQQYLPLLEIIGRAWPGFCAALLIHLVDCVLSTEMMTVEQGSDNTESVHKLFFLSAWIRIMVSQRFVSKVNPEFKGNGKSTFASSDKQVPLATYESIQALRYPLNSLCDRLVDYENNKTINDILQFFEEILGPHRSICHGIVLSRHDGAMEKPMIAQSEGHSREEGEHDLVQNNDKLSLNDIEALLSDDEKALPSNVRPASTKTDVDISSHRTLVWTRCTSWDTCSIGTLPGHPV